MHPLYINFLALSFCLSHLSSVWPSAFWILISCLTRLDKFALVLLFAFSWPLTVFILQVNLSCPFICLSLSRAFGSSSAFTEPLQLAFGAAEPVSVAVWSGLIKAGICCSQQREWTGRKHRLTVLWVGFLLARMTEAVTNALFRVRVD